MYNQHQRQKRRLEEENKVRALISNDQFDLKRHTDTKYMGMVAREILDWSQGRLQKTVERILTKEKENERKRAAYNKYKR